MSDAREIRLFDPRREPRDWTDLIGPTQCAVFLKDRTTSTSLDANGKLYAQPNETPCFVFDGIDDARAFCEARVQAVPLLRCEVYDSEGLAQPSMLVVVHPDFEHAEDSSASWSRRRKLIAVLLFLAAPPLVWMDMRRANELVVPTFLAFTCILTGLRFFYWDYGVKNRERERQRRLEDHCRKERGDA